VRTVGAFDTVWRSLVPAALILGAGLVAYVGDAAGDFGPMVAFGRADANAGIQYAWIQLPLHAGLAFLLLIGRPRGLLWLPWAAAGMGLILLVVWAAFLTLVLVDRLFTAVYPMALGSAILLLLLYGAALYLTFEEGAAHARRLFSRLSQGSAARTRASRQ
jgi:hypothetical protein